jgi:hypothetical protein
VKKLLVVVALVLGTIGGSVAFAPSASAVPIDIGGGITGDPPNDEQLCIRVNVTIFGNHIGTGAEFICIP